MKKLILTFILCLINISNVSALGLVQAYNFVDRPFGTYTPGVNTNNLSATSNFSITIVSLLGPVTLRFTSTNASGTIFWVKNSIGNYYIPYSLVFYSAIGGTGTAYSMSSGVATSSLSILTLGVPLTASIGITFSSASLQTAGAGTYSDTLTIVITAV